MDLDRLKALIAVAEHSSIAAAAESLRIGRSTLRRRLAELKEDVGAPLVVRSGRKVALTAAGEVLTHEGKEFVARCREIVTSVQASTGGVTGEYRVAGQIGMQGRRLSRILAGHLARFPALRLRLLPVAVPMALLPEQADVAITLAPRPTNGSWLTVVIRRLEERVVASRSYLARHGSPRCVDELHQHSLLSWIPPGEKPGDWPLRTGGSVSVQPSITSPDIQLIEHCTLSDMGLARLPYVPVSSPDRHVDDLVPVLPEVIGRELSLRVVVPDTPRMRGPFRRFLASIRTGIDEILLTCTTWTRYAHSWR